LGNFQILWYVQKDKEVGYAVKGHSKMYIFDRQIAIIGGSNLMPTAFTMNDDCDVMTKGPAAAEISDIFRLRWMAHKSQTPQVCSNYFDDYTDPDYTASPSPVSDVDVGGWDDDEAYPKVVYSEPSIHGDDPIFRAVLGVLRSAKREFRMCMGFAAFTAPFIAQCYEATRRGVRVQLLCNSRYSADLSCPQTDMCLSIAALLRHAPLVEVYVTYQKRAEDDYIPTVTTVSAEDWGTTDAGEKAETGEGEDKAEEVRARARTLTYAMNDAAASMQQGSLGPRPTFVHSKYVVADSTLVCLGSWNCWPRSSFYEHECNVVVSAPGLARRIEDKFELAKKSNAVRLRDPEMLAKGGMFTPLGCSICKPYGPCLFTDELCQGAMAQLAELERTKAET
jgi:phosphatidylserine/phosphatidylglycerophosphate/cardiolipin synthase-like enzyme